MAADNLEVMHVDQNRQASPIYIDKNADPGNVSNDDFPPFIPSPRHNEFPELEMEYQSIWT